MPIDFSETRGFITAVREGTVCHPNRSRNMASLDRQSSPPKSKLCLSMSRFHETLFYPTSCTEVLYKFKENPPKDSVTSTTS